MTIKQKAISSVIQYMRLSLRIVASFYIGFLVYTSLVLVFGSAGFLALKKLELYKGRLDENIEELKSNHQALSRQRDSLLTNVEEIQLRARELGYLVSGEEIVVLPTSSKNNQRHTLGRITLNPTLSNNGYTSYRAIGCGAALLGFILLSLIQVRKYDRESR